MSQQKAIKVTKYLDKMHMFLRANACTTVDSWGYLLVFIFNNGVWQRPLIFWLMGNDSIPHTSRLPLQICKSCLICPKIITGGNNSCNAPPIWTLILDVLGKKIIKKEQTTTRGCQVHLKRWLILYLWIKTFQISLFTQHCHSGWQPSRTMVQKCVEWIILLLIEEDQNKSSANLFSGLRSGVWCNETQISYLFYHSKNTSGDFDYWTAVKWYPFFSF